MDDSEGEAFLSADAELERDCINKFYPANSGNTRRLSAARHANLLRRQSLEEIGETPPPTEADIATRCVFDPISKLPGPP